MWFFWFWLGLFLKILTIHKFRYLSYHEKFLHFPFSPYTKMSGKHIIFHDNKINKSNFYKNKKLFDVYEMEVDKILISKKQSYGKKSSFKYFLRYNDNDVIWPLCIKLPQMIGYVKHFDSNKTMSFKVNDIRLLKKCTKIWEKVDIS